MISDPTAFERYRNTATEKTNLPRLIIGTAVVVLFWVAITLVVVLGGTYLAIIWHLLPGDPRGPLQGFLASPIGILTALTSFAGIWLGLWLAMRFVHGEPLTALLAPAAASPGRASSRAWSRC